MRGSLRHGRAGIEGKCIEVGDLSVPQGAFGKTLLGAGVMRRVAVHAQLDTGVDRQVVFRSHDAGLSVCCPPQQKASRGRTKIFAYRFDAHVISPHPTYRDALIPDLSNERGSIPSTHFRKCFEDVLGIKKAQKLLRRLSSRALHYTSAQLVIYRTSSIDRDLRRLRLAGRCPEALR